MVTKKTIGGLPFTLYDLINSKESTEALLNALPKPDYSRKSGVKSVGVKSVGVGPEDDYHLGFVGGIDYFGSNK